MIALDQLLRGRDERVARQAELLGEFPGKTLLCFTVVLPGPVKRDSRSERIAAAGVDAVRKEFGAPGSDETAIESAASGIIYEELRDLETGFEGFFIVATSPLEAKRRCCAIEDGHPLGRLMDIDVIVPVPEPVEGGVTGEPVALELQLSPLGRDVVGFEPRRCLLCGRPARECVRSRTHETADLITKIDELLDNA